MDKKSLKSFTTNRISLEFAIVVFAAIGLFIAMNASHLFEKFHEPISPNHEKLDKILLAIAFLAVAMMIFSLRRWLELRKIYINLAKSEEQLRFQETLLDKIGDSITATDLEGKIVYANQAKCNWTNKTRDELIGKPIEVFGHTPCFGTTYQEILKIALEKSEWTGKVTNTASDGSRITGECSIWPVKDKTGKPTCMCGVTRNVTERELNEQELLKHKQYLEALDKASGILLLSISQIPYEEFLAALGEGSGADRVALFIKKTLPDDKIAIYKSAQWIKNKTISLINFKEVNDLFLANIWPKWQKILSQGHAISSLYADFPAEEQPFWKTLDVKAILVLPIIIDNELEGFIGFDNCTEGRLWTKAEADFLHTAASDLAITLKQLEYKKELKQERDFAQRLVETAQTIVLVMDDNGNIVTFNPYFEKLTGYKLGEVKGKNWFNIFLPSQDKQKITQLFQQAVQDVQIDGNVNSIITKDGRLLHIEWYGRTLKDYDGKIIGVLSTGHDITERIKADELLRESEEKFRTIFEGSNDGILIVDATDKKFLTGNKAICNMIGYSIEEIRKMGISDIHPTKDLPFVEEQFDKQKKNEITLAENIPMRRKNGSIFFADIKSNSIILSGKTYLIGSFRDITERKQVEEMVRKNETLFKSVLTAVPLGIGVVADRKITWANDNFLQIVGRSKDEIINQSTRVLYMNDEEYDSIDNRYYKDLRENGKAEIEIKWKHKDGRILDIFLTGVVLDMLDMSCGVVFGALDISERKRAEELLRESEERYRLIFNGITDAVFIHGIGDDDLPERFLAVNDVACKRLGYSREELLCLSPGHIDAKNPAIDVRPYSKKLKLGENVLFEQIHIAKDGRSIPVEINAQSFLMHGRHLVLSVVRDITERKLVEEERKKSHLELEQRVKERTAELQGANTALLKAMEERNHIQKLLSEMEKLAAAGKLAAQIAHEINNPLAGIKNSFLLVKDAIPTGHRYFEYVGRIEKEIDRVSQIVRHMFDLYRPQTAPVEKFRLYETIEDIIELLKIARQEKNINIEIDCDPNIVITLSEALLRQVIYNIVQNAIQACNEQTTVKVFASVQNNKLKFSVSDQGQGIDDKIKDKIFMPFFTTGSGGPKSGLGLGLAITKDIIIAMDGTIDFVSEKGKGTTFNILIPVSNEKI
jgi:PAS domain S-box-containing protein